MPNPRALGRRLSCLVVGLVDGSPISTVLAEAGFEVTHRAAAQDSMKTLDGELHWGVVFVSDSLSKPALQTIIDRSASTRPPSPVVVVGMENGPGDNGAASALQLGAADFIGPPFTREALENKLRPLLSESDETLSETTRSMEQLGLIGSSPAMAKLKESLSRIARYKADVLILGESGSGKETIARALHELGPRRREAFLALGCAGAAGETLEHELFGSRGDGRPQGLLDSVQGGTLFLDEVGELDLQTQARLARALEGADFTVIASAAQDLERAVAARKFREDLHQRLKVVTLSVPPLRERREDIPELVRWFVEDFNRRHQGNIRGLSPQALERLAQHDWPGNVRDLKNAIECAAVMAASDTIEALDFQEAYFKPRAADPLTGPGADLLTIPANATMSDVERIVIAEHLRRARTKADAARSLGMGLRTLYTKIGKFRLTDVARNNRSRTERS
jgi:DNA-binding NtrC family response regulator